MMPPATPRRPRFVRSPRADDWLLVLPGVGLVAALNFGLAQARAPLVARMDAARCCAAQAPGAPSLHFSHRNLGVALVGAQVAFIDASGPLTGERTHFPTDPFFPPRRFLRAAASSSIRASSRAAKRCYKRAAIARRSPRPRTTICGCASPRALPRQPARVLHDRVHPEQVSPPPPPPSASPAIWRGSRRARVPPDLSIAPKRCCALIARPPRRPLPPRSRRSPAPGPRARLFRGGRATRRRAAMRSPP